MCVIAFSPKGYEAPTEQQIKDMFDANPDGAGFAYNGRNGKVYYKKGFKTVKELLEALCPLEQWTNKNLAIHFRIGTSGENDAYTCHPFKISTKFDELRKLEGRGPVLFHNGILGTGGQLNKLSSDTQDFTSAFAPMLKKYNKSKNRDLWIEEMMGGVNRLLLMYDNNKYKAYGKWEVDGTVFVSNLNYKWRKYTSEYYKTSYPYKTSTPSANATTAVKEDTTQTNYTRYDLDYGYEDGGYSEFWAQKDYEQEKKLAEALYARVDMDNFLDLEEGELAVLLDWADEYTENVIIKDGKEYMYDAVEDQIWTNDFTE